jgi:hypothetical protein
MLPSTQARLITSTLRTIVSLYRRKKNKERILEEKDDNDSLKLTPTQYKIVFVIFVITLIVASFN